MRKRYEKIMFGLNERPDYQWLLTIWGILILAWSRAYLALFPGTFGYDAPTQLLYITGERAISSHHPVLHTWILGCFLKFGELVAKNMNVGVALYSLTQGMVVTLGIAWSIVYTKKRISSLWVIVVEILFAALNPALQILTFSVTKDILFGAFLLIFATALGDWFREEKSNTDKHSVKEIIVLALSGTMMCLLRNQGVYILVAVILICILFYKKQKQLLLILLAVFLVSEIFFGICTYCIGCEKGDKREMLSIPMQQLACVYYMNHQYDIGKINQEQIEQIEGLIPKENLMSFTARTADVVKSGFKTQVFMEEPEKYISLYFKVGVQNPFLYWQAFWNLNEPYWKISENDYRILSMTNIYAEISEKYGIRQSTLDDSYRLKLLDVIDNKYEKKIPIVSWLLEPGIGIWIMLFIVVIAIRNKDKKDIVLLSPILLYFFTMILGPVALMRYIYPITIATPLLIGVLYDEIKHYLEGEGNGQNCSIDSML